MEYEILKNGNLKISVDIPTQQELYSQYQEYLEMEKNGEYLDVSFESDAFMYDTLEPFLCNSEYDWIRPEEIGALTNAPILGIRSENEKDIDNVFWFPDYAVNSPQRELAKQGYTIFESANNA